MSLGKLVFSKTAHTIFLKLPMKLGGLKGKKLMEPDFWGTPQNTPEIRFFGVFQNKKKN